MADVTVELGNAYIGSAYSPVVVITETAEGHTVSITSADPEAQGQLVTQSYTVPDWSDEEAEREAQEAARQAAESAREAAEDERAEAEQARAAAESGRANAEAERRGYEQARRADESARVAAEQARQAAESARAGAESVRQSAEQSRSASEVERRQAEFERRLAEELREQAESARQSAEQARDAAEQERQTDTAAAVSAANTATSNAQAATTAAQAATTAADTAAQGADEAAERADTAREAIDSHLRWADGNVLVGHLPEGGMLQADDAYATLPIAATAYGASTQDGTPAPDAPVPIASVTDLTLMLTGRNLFDAGAVVEASNKGVTIAPSTDGWISVTGESTATSASLIRLWGTNDTTILPGGTYTLLVETDGTPFVSGRIRLQVYGSSEGSSSTYIHEAGTYRLDYDSVTRVSFMLGSNSTGYSVDGRFRLTLVRGTEAPSAYIPYEGTTLPIDLDGHELRSLPDGTRDELAVDALGHVTLTQRVGSTTQAATEGVTGTVGVDVMSTTGEIADGATVTYALADEQVIDLGTVTLPTLPSPDLTAWPATDVPTTMALDYERDIELALTEARDEAMAAIADPDGPTATANHAAGTYLTMGGRLYKVTTAIATGEAITPGTNVTATTVMAEVLSLTQ